MLLAMLSEELRFERWVLVGTPGDKYKTKGDQMYELFEIAGLEGGVPALVAYGVAFGISTFFVGAFASFEG